MNYLGLIVTIIVFIKFFKDLGSVISIKNIFSVLICLQFLLGPFLVYNGFEDYQAYPMRVSEDDYFFFVTPAILAFLLGLFVVLPLTRKSPEYSDTASLVLWYRQNPNVPVAFIITGFLFSFIRQWVPGEFGFIAYLLSNLNFIGLFLILLAEIKLPVKWLILIYGSIIISSFSGGMFHDLFIWSIFFLAVICFKYKFKGSIKLALISILIVGGIFVQTIKSDLRQRIWEQGEELSLNVVEDSYKANVDRSGGFLSTENLAPQITRVNQGWIVASLMNIVPRNVDFAHGELIYKYLEAAILPRFLAPDKLMSGDKEIFNKYSGHFISAGTSTGISSVGDAYINYGIYGGWFFMLIYGLLYALIIRYFTNLSFIYPTSFVFCFLLMFYAVRPDCELQTILGHLVKTGILLLVLYKAFGKHFRIRTQAEDV